MNILRVTPKSFYGTQLYNVVEWLLKYIGSPIANCRLKCFNMANCLSENVKGNYLTNIFKCSFMPYGNVNY